MDSDFRWFIVITIIVFTLVGIAIAVVTRPTTLTSKKKVLTPIRYELVVTDNKVDTLWVYDIKNVE